MKRLMSTFAIVVLGTGVLLSQAAPNSRKDEQNSPDAQPSMENPPGAGHDQPYSGPEVPTSDRNEKATEDWKANSSGEDAKASGGWGTKKSDQSGAGKTVGNQKDQVNPHDNNAGPLTKDDDKDKSPQ